MSEPVTMSNQPPTEEQQLALDIMKLITNMAKSAEIALPNPIKLSVDYDTEGVPAEEYPKLVCICVSFEWKERVDYSENWNIQINDYLWDTPLDPYNEVSLEERMNYCLHAAQRLWSSLSPFFKERRPYCIYLDHRQPFNVIFIDFAPLTAVMTGKHPEKIILGYFKGESNAINAKVSTQNELERFCNARQDSYDEALRTGQLPSHVIRPYDESDIISHLLVFAHGLEGRLDAIQGLKRHE